MWLLWGMIGFAHAGWEPVACDTLQRLREAPRYQAVDEPGLRVNGKGQRDAFNDGFSNQIVTSNFVLKWGNSQTFTPTEIDSLIRAFERSWEVENDQMGHELPDGTSQYLFNVYIGDTGENTPDVMGAAGYFTLDPEGWPMVVMSPDVVRWPEYAAKVAAHEWYHVLQYQAQQFAYDGIDAWFWEASANWASSEVYPDQIQFISQFIAAHLVHPHYPVDYFDYPDTGALIEGYQYGAAILPMHLSRALDDWTVVADTWKNPSEGASPLVRLAEEVELRGASFDAMWLDLVAKSAVVDFESDWEVRQGLDMVQGYPEYDNLTERVVPAGGDEDWVRVSDDLKPMRYGYNTIRMQSLGEGVLNIHVEGDLNGSWNTPARWGGRIIVQQAENQYLELPFDDNVAHMALELTGDERSVWLVVGVMTNDLMGDAWSRERFGYQTRFQWEEPPEPEPPVKADPIHEEEELAGCACDSSTAPLPVLWLLMPLLWRRRMQG